MDIGGNDWSESPRTVVGIAPVLPVCVGIEAQREKEVAAWVLLLHERLDQLLDGRVVSVAREGLKVGDDPFVDGVHHSADALLGLHGGKSKR